MANATTAKQATAQPVSVTRLLEIALSPLASLKLTVALFSFSIFIVLVGTLAQEDMDMWDVNRAYFESIFAWVDLQLFFPDSFALSLTGETVSVSGGFYAPGGALIGSLLMLNLLSAHLIRFRMQAKGQRLWAGLAVTAIGVFVTWLVIEGGHSREGVQGVPYFEWSTLWLVFKISLVVLWFLAIYTLFRLDQQRVVEKWTLITVSILLASVILYLLYFGEEASLSASSMRILWQLLQGTFAGVVLLAGCLLLFKKRAGIVVMHGGVALLMLNFFFVSLFAVEERMTIPEGETVNYTQDIRFTELAIVDPSDEEFDDVVAIPQWMLLKSLRTKERIQHADLPFDVEVTEYFKNSRLADVEPSEPNLANAGAGVSTKAVEQKASSGADSNAQVDLASAYVALYEKGGDRLIGKHLVSLLLSLQDFGEKLAVGDKDYRMFLRFRRTYQPYAISLVDVRRDDYMGTDTPKNYSSEIRLVDSSRQTDMEKKIWMNNPLRYAGQTFYQSGYQVDGGVEVTDLQVVTNTGWMIPYVSCMIVAVGMFFHFGNTLMRFLRRRVDDEQRLTRDRGVEQPESGGGKNTGKRGKQRRQAPPPPPAADSSAPKSPLDFIRIGGGVSWAVAVCFAGLLSVMALRNVASKGDEREMNLTAFGELPVMYQGRIKPFDTLARNMLRVISDRDYLEVSDDNGDDEKRPAIHWLLHVIAETDEARDFHVFRIDSPEVQQTLGVSRRKGHRYSVNELAKNFEEFEEQLNVAKKLPPRQISVYQRRLLELDKRLQRYLLLTAAFRPQPFPKFPSEEEFQKDREKVTQRLMVIKRLLDETPARDEQLSKMEPPLAVPDTDPDADWMPYSTASNKAYVQTSVIREEPNPFTLHMQGIVTSFRDRNRGDFNDHVAAYRAALEKAPPTKLNLKKTDYESFYNRLAPFGNAMVFYILAMILSFFSLLAIGVAVTGPRGSPSIWTNMPASINRMAFMLIVATFVLHTFALASRIYISGRPPVTNLYSSAIFIGWGCVLVGIVIELLFRLSIGNVIASIVGFSTLIIASKLSGDGDTMAVLQAVLDTQFWLSTHVVSITFGYATTFLAGGLGLIYIVCGLCTPVLDKQVNREFCRMIYAVLCFSIFFSFVGTVLGGLWADDSWGRFWGWDPKENGALIIVIWNALVLHARWGGMVRDRGLAVLAVGGNIATSWSWFGVNELGVGLHSYGFTNGVLLVLLLFVGSQLAFIAAGLLPRQLWWSFRKNGLV